MKTSGFHEPSAKRTSTSNRLMRSPRGKHERDGDLLRRIGPLIRPFRPKPAGLPPRLRPLPGVRAVLFDLYGTLLACRHDPVSRQDPARQASRFAAALRAAGWRPSGSVAGRRAAELFHSLIKKELRNKRRAGIAHPEVEVGGIWAEAAGRLARDKLIPAPPSRRMIAAMAVEAELRLNPVWPMPGAAETLRGLRRRGIRIGIVSNAQFYTPLLLRWLVLNGLLPDAFDQRLAIYSYSLGEAKPSPRPLGKLLGACRRRFGITPAETICIGNDIRNDLLPAVRLGARTALFAGDRSSLRLRKGNAWCAGIRPDIVVTCLPQLLRALVRGKADGKRGLLTVERPFG